MKTTIKNISLLVASLALSASLTTATAQYTNSFGDTEPTTPTYVDPVAAIHQNIANLELEMESLRMVDKRSLTKAEKRAWKRKKRFTRRRLHQQYDMLGRITNPAANWGFYGQNPWFWGNPRPRRVIVRNNGTYCPPVNSQNRNNTSVATPAPSRSSLKNQRAVPNTRVKRTATFRK